MTSTGPFIGYHDVDMVHRMPILLGLSLLYSFPFPQSIRLAYVEIMMSMLDDLWHTMVVCHIKVTPIMALFGIFHRQGYNS